MQSHVKRITNHQIMIDGQA